MNVCDRSGFRRLGVLYYHFDLKGMQEEVMFRKNERKWCFQMRGNIEVLKIPTNEITPFL